MRHASFKSFLIAALMLLALGGSFALKPSENASAVRPVADLETVIPKAFGDWRIDGSIIPIEPAPDVKESLTKIYSQTLSLTYVNRQGQRIMLSVAYSDGIDRQLDIHRPEYCYPAQGFTVSEYIDTVLDVGVGSLPLRRLVATQGRRIEPISYWITIADKAVSSTIERKLLKIRYGLTGQIGSGMLVRVSSIERDQKLAYRTHDDFIRTLIASMPENHRAFIVGQLKVS